MFKKCVDCFPQIHIGLIYENIKRQHDFIIRETDSFYESCGILTHSLNYARNNLFNMEPPLNQYYSLSNMQIFKI